MGSAAKRLAKGRKQRQRTGRALRILENGGVNVIQILEEAPEAYARVPIFDLLRRTPSMGREGAKKILVRAEVWPYDRLVQIPLPTRRKIISLLPERIRYPDAA